MNSSDLNKIVDKYVGIPFKDPGDSFKGCDCYGLVKLLYREEFGLSLPEVGDLYTSAYKRHEVDKTLSAHIDYDWCKKVQKDEPLKPFDMLVFRIAGTDHHVGLYIREGYMLHVVEGSDSGVERYTGVRWGKQLHRVIRHKVYEQRVNGTAN